MDAFRSSENSIMTLATSFETLVKVEKERSATGVKQTEEMLHAEWIQMMEMCLWGNATVSELLI